MAVRTTRAGERQQGPSRQVLAETPARVVTFLYAMGTNGALQAAMAQGGFSRADHDEGWALLQRACGFAEASDPEAEDTPARRAMQEIAEWVGAHCERLQMAIARLHPEHVDLFAGIGAPEEGAAVLALATLLARIEDKERSGDATELLATLARRRLDGRERARLSALVVTAQAARARGSTAPARISRREELIALYRWYKDWTTTAGSLLGRKSFYIALGMAQRARRGGVGGSGASGASGDGGGSE
jgi:hypothetical protein